MTVFVEPGNTQSTHHISLSDGLRIVGIDACDSQGNKNPLSITRAPVPRTALKTSSGDQKYSDFEPPWSPISQNSWLGGRGLDDAEADITRYFDGYCADTCFGTIFIGPQVQYAKGYRTTEDNVPGNVVWRLLQDTTLHNAGLVLSTVTATMQAIAMLIRCKGTPTASLTISIYTNTAGAPGTLLKSVVLTPASFTDTTSEWYRFMFSSTLAYVAATYYWIVFSSTAGTSKDHWEVGVKQLPSVDATCLSSPDGATWTTTDKYPYYRIEDVPTAGTWYLFRFRYLTYAYLNIDGAAPKLYKNGDRGMADANTGQLTTLIDGTKTWLTDQWEGYTVQLIGGTGAGEQQGWRTIVSNTATVLTVSPAWLIEQDTTTEYVIIGSNQWTEVTGHGLTVPITDVCMIGDLAYFCQGDAVILRRMHIKSDGTHEWAVDGTNKAVFLCLEANTDVWKANNEGGIKVAKAPKQTAWGTDMTFGTAITLAGDYGRITNLIEYTNKLWIMREGMVFFNDAGVLTPVALKEMRTVMSYTNGRAALTHNVYLYFAIGSGLERYYAPALDDVGPDRDRGLPTNRKGIISATEGYPGRFFIAVDASATGYSSVVENNGSGWHEIYRAPLGQRITALGFEPTPGTLLDRLWVAQGSDLVWLPFPSGTLDPRNDPAYLYAPEGCITSGYFYAGLYDAIKYIHSLKLFSEHLADGICIVEAEYELDDETTWHPLEDYYKVSPLDEVLINPHSVLGSVTGRRIRYRVHLLTSDATKSPEIKGIVMEAITRVPIKYSYSLPYRIKDEPNEDTALTKRDILEGWAANITPLTMRCIFKAYDSKTVFIDPSPSRPYQQTQEGYIETMTVLEV